MSDTVIAVENLSKRYLVGHQFAPRQRSTTLRDVITREARNFARKAGDLFRGRQIVEGDAVEEFWALKNVNFEVKIGEVVGIIGRNGAGKSTLLKILSRITEPTEGRVRLRGRVASLLEVGTGFHQELTGRENIFLNGAILGMTRGEIRTKFDEIVEFAEVEKFLDTPVKRYSSGMYVRLAFSVAAHLEPEILIVDEVLAVGDIEFQRKCLGKIDQVSRKDGRTVLFVSHQMSAVSSLCSRAIQLGSGQIVKIGPAKEVVNAYLFSSSTDVDEIRFVPRPGIPSITRIVVKAKKGELSIELDFESDQPFIPHPGVAICSPQGAPLYCSNSRFHPDGYELTSTSSGTLKFLASDLPLTTGMYLISAYLGDWERDYDVKEHILQFFFPGEPLHPMRPNGAGYIKNVGSWRLAQPDLTPSRPREIVGDF